MKTNSNKQIEKPVERKPVVLVFIYYTYTQQSRSDRSVSLCNLLQFSAVFLLLSKVSTKYKTNGQENEVRLPFWAIFLLSYANWLLGKQQTSRFVIFVLFSTTTTTIIIIVFFPSFFRNICVHVRK